MMDYGENGYLHSKIKIIGGRGAGGEGLGGGVGIKMSWVEKYRKITSRGGGTIIRDSRV